MTTSPFPDETNARPSFRRSSELRVRAHRAIPGGCHTYAKGDDQYPMLSPGFIERGEGCHVFDVDGNRFIEYGMGNRAVGLGHAYPPVVAAAMEAMRFGANFTRPARIEIECAEAFLELIEGADMVKFCKDGSDATSGAVKLARAFTGRDLVACCGDHPFFSVDDWFIATTAMDAGIPEPVKRLTLTFRYNDIASVKALFEAYPDRIACLILEPARIDEPESGFLHAVKALCHANGAVFILDEMITGFRWDAGGAQKVYGITPDLSTFGKALGNGFSISALAGRRELMELGGLEQTERPRVFLLSTTHGAETHAMAAAIETMRIYRDEAVTEHLHRMGRMLREGVEAAIVARGLGEHFRVIGRDCSLAYAALDADRRPSQAFRSLFLQETIRRGVLAPSFVTSYSHGPSEIDATIEAVDAALAVYARALSDGVERHLVGAPSESVYRRFNTKATVTQPACGRHNPAVPHAGSAEAIGVSAARDAREAVRA